MGIRKLKKNVAENKFMFPLEMYTSLPGSVIITSYILNEEKPDLLQIRKKWKYYTRHGLGFDFSDPEYLKKLCEKFEVKMFPLDQSLMLLSALTLKLRKARKTFYHSGKTVIIQELWEKGKYIHFLKRWKMTRRCKYG